MPDRDLPGDSSDIFAQPTVADRIWRRLQGHRLRPAEHELVRRTVRALGEPEGASHLELSGRREAFLTGEALVECGDAGRDLFILLEGDVTVELGSRVVEHLRPGQVFGEIALLGDGTRMATVRAIGRVVALRVPPDAVDGPLRTRLWEYAAERRFMDLLDAPVPDDDARRLWWMEARHAKMQPGTYEAGAPWLFVYDGQVEVDGRLQVGPALVRGGALKVLTPARLALLPTPRV